ncbi:MAG: hypothetical protein ACI97K_000734 [Glaciecola sp.]|jgi:hypothetical protein
MVTELIDTIENRIRKRDALEMLVLMQKWTKYKAYTCGRMVGFGTYYYKYASGQGGDSFVTGFSARNLSMFASKKGVLCQEN